MRNHLTDLALRLLDEGSLTSVGVAPMPVMGVTAPLDWVAAWAQGLAEAVGTGLALEVMGFDHCWVMATFDRRTTGSWLADPAGPLDRARARADATLTAYTYERDAATMAELQRIIRQAEKELASP